MMLKKLALLGSLAVFSVLAHAEPRPPQERMSGRSSEYQQGFQDGWRAAYEMMQNGGNGWNNNGNNWGNNNDGYRRDIRIDRARYVSGKRSCDFTRNLANRANGRGEYLLEASNRWCGDPSPGDLKQAEVRYYCGDDLRSAIVKEDESRWLRCP
ncbi:hypothetical protein [Chitinilyticum litopenaei]|uniref:hypothetical protein n=1 Tax=Chitinilyticum litopenaei TaxID=1121276 RepID=UPI0004280485|nr:hypothetical protein [Chitinilyticum litopenaei]